MSHTSSQTTVGDPKEPTNSSTKATEPEEFANPSVCTQQQEEETHCVSSNKKEAMEGEKRQRALSQKAIRNAIQNKEIELKAEEKALNMASNSAYDALKNKASLKEIKTILMSLQQSYMKYERVLTDIGALYKQDKWSELSEQAQEHEGSGRITLRYAQNAINEIKEYQKSCTDETVSLSSRRTRRTTSSRTTSSTGSARRRALAEAAAAKQQAQYDRLMAEKENERKKYEAEEELRRQLMRAQHERDMAMLSIEKVTAVADAKLQAIEQSILEEERLSILEDENEAEDSRSRTEAWINTQDLHHENPTALKNEEEDKGLQSNQSIRIKSTPTAPPPADTAVSGERKDHAKLPKPFFPRGFAGNEPIYRPTATTPEVVVTNRCIEGIAETSQQLAASLARQNLPKCHPDVFDGDATLFNPWKNSFKAMIQDTNLNPSQEIAYLRNYTKGKARDLVDNFRKRQHDDPTTNLDKLWAELERRFGNTAVITNALLEKLREAAKFSGRDNVKLQVFADVCADVDDQMAHLRGLACLNYPTAIRPIVDNLPNFLRFKWEKKVVGHADENEDAYPGFHAFAMIIQKQARLRNHPNVLAGESPNNENASKKREKRWSPELSGKREIESNTVLKSASGDKDDRDKEKSEATREKYCAFHERKGHELGECIAFGGKTLDEKTQWIKNAGLCFRCLVANHRASQCNEKVSCGKCNSNRHPTILHKEREAKDDGDHGEELQSKCTSVCQGKTGGLSCSKTVLVDVFAENRPELSHRVYAIIDDQSNASMISPKLIDLLGVDGPKENYLLSTCSSTKETKYGRRISGLIVRSLTGTAVKLPKLIECDHIPQDKREIPTPAMTAHFPHLREITKEIPPLDQGAQIEILIGRDAPELLKVRAFKNGPKGAPWAQRLILGWTVSGQMCLDRVGGPVHMQTRTTSIEIADVKRVPITRVNERPNTPDAVSEFETVPCPNFFKVKERYTERSAKGEEMKDIYYTTPEDNDTSTSWEDRRFLEIMNQGIHKNNLGNWEMPLPFRCEDVAMPNNREQALSRLHGLLRTFKKKPQMEKDYFEFLGKVFERGHAVRVPPDECSEKQTLRTTGDPLDNRCGKVWYLPHFGVYHPKKPDQIRVVFDSSCEYQGMSLNKELLTGPDLMNSLIGVLMRFRQENTGVVCDVEQMFHSFHVEPKDRDFLRFLWFENNDPSQEIVDYRMVVHLFGNGPSPAVATFGMRKTADEGEEGYGAEVKKFIHEDFYVDDGLTSRSTDEEAIELIKGARAALATANLRLHKVASNSADVMEAFPAEDRAKNIQDLDLQRDSLPSQRSLGVQWDLQKDTFTFNVSVPEKPFTRRGVLSVVNSLYDPLGLAAPVILVGKLLLQQLVILGREKQSNCSLGWDDPLPENLKRQWLCWKNELPELENVAIQRCYHPANFGRVVQNEVHAFSDASKDATGTAVYLKQVNEAGAVSVTLAFGQAKVAPIQPTSVPRLELCAAVLSTQAVKRLKKELDLDIHRVLYYTDSNVVLGYIKSEVRRFHVYVANRVQLIRDVSEPNQWRYVETSKNPADLATLGVSAKALKNSDWLKGPLSLQETSLNPPSVDDLGARIDENDPEVRKQANVFCTKSTKASELGAKRFERFSNWSTLRRAIANLVMRVKQCKITPDLQVSQRDQETVGNRSLRQRYLNTAQR